MTRPTVNPFQESMVPCPLCEAEQEQFTIKRTLYTEKSRDIDLRPKSVDWNPKASPKVDPKVYFFWECDNCHFCADHKSYAKPFADGVISATRFRKLLRASLEQDTRYPKLLELLSTSESSAPQFMKAMMRCFLAIYQLEINDEIRSKEPLKIGSYYLRLAWMIRDIKSSRVKAEKFKLPTRELLQDLKKIWPGIPLTEMGFLSKAIDNYSASLKQSQAIKTTLSEIQISLIVARLYLQIGDLVAAKQIIIENKARAKNYELIVRQKEKSARLDDKAIDKMVVMAGKAISLVKNVELIYERLEEQRLTEEVIKAKEYLKKSKLAKKEVAEQRQGLIDKGFEETVVNRVCPLPKKKGLLEFLKSS